MTMHTPVSAGGRTASCPRRLHHIPRTATLALTAAVGLLATAVMLLTPVSAQAVTRYAQPALHAAAARAGAGAAFCNPYGGLSASGDSLDDVYPCANPDISDSFGYQCVEYSSRFESVVYGLGGITGPGADVVDQLHANDKVPIGSPGPGVLPAPGDVVSMWGQNQDPDGHTGVVSAVRVNASGTGTITYLDENGSLAGNGDSIGYDTITVSGWKWSVSWAAPYAYNQFNFTEQAAVTSASPPAAAVTGNGTAYVFWKGTDGNLWEAQGPAAGALSGPYNRGMGALGSAPAAGVNSSGATYVYWEGTDRNLWEAYWTGTKWAGPYNRGMGPLS